MSFHTLVLILALFCAGAAAAEPAPGKVVVVQCNSYYGGMYSGAALKPVTWQTAGRFAGWVAASCPAAAIIGVQEVKAEAAEKIEGFLSTRTGRTWSHLFNPQGLNGRSSGNAILYRTDRLRLVQELGTVEVETLDTGYHVEFLGGVFEDRLGGHRFGMFTGKLVWGGKSVKVHGVTVNESIRALGASRLLTFVSRSMAAYKGAPALIAMDMNSPRGTLTYERMASQCQNDGSTAFTHNSFHGTHLLNKYDYLWYRPAAGSRRKGFTVAAHRSPHFGSDHRALWAEVDVQN